MNRSSEEMSPLVDKVISGGQSGVDRGALDAARWLGIEHGGWCPRGRRSEDGPIPHLYQLRETNQADYSVRTERNVVEADGTLILYRGELSGGTELTRRLALRHQRPLLLMDLDEPLEPGDLRAWITDHGVRVLNVAGPRESSCPGITDEARRMVIGALSDGI